MGHPTVYPTGTTIYDNPAQCWNGYTIFIALETGATLIDMNGRVVKQWEGLHGFPNKLLPGGFVMGSLGERNSKYGYMDQIDLVQVDWEGNVVWKFDQYEFIEDPGEEPMWMARQHHDFQRQGNPVGYYAPGLEPQTDKGNTLILSHKIVHESRISDKPLLDDVILEVNWEGDIIWEWVCSEHFDELDFSEEAKNVLARKPNLVVGDGQVGDWMHINSMSALGPNQWYENGDDRFHPDNIIWDSRQTNIIAITDKKSGKIVWKMGPDYTWPKELRKLGWIIGQHHAHLIPKGLPGEGHLLVFDNGGFAGYGSPNPGSLQGHNNALRDYSRVLEINPVTFEIVWEYSPATAGFLPKMKDHMFYSPLVSSAQRLINGNTLITEGSSGRIFEVTQQYEIVWEYISPYFGANGRSNDVYRAYRVPYEWVPQLLKPEELPVPRINIEQFRVPGSIYEPEQNTTKVEGVRGFNEETQLCVVSEI